MDVTFHRLAGNLYITTAVRADGVTVTSPGYDRTSAIPHDLAHFVAEREFGMTRGFWGSVAAGALFTNMAVASGRQKPDAAERSKRIIKAHADDIGLAEAAAGAIHDAVEHDLTSKEVVARLRALWGVISPAPLPVGDKDIEAASAALRREAARWSAVPVDQGLTLNWPLRVEHVPTPRPGKARTGRRSRKARHQR
ncbi:hypothetical protein [Actinomadura sp. 9N215]|uniref:hypothetical protein n=1 Tax=Actinomadura sp. 9N215 TaxID=3375150 RepID=UPI0037A2C62C